ncbi:MAG: hypothetical protein ACOX5R_16550 [bacterium]
MKTLAIAKYEAKMSSRGWRFWLMLSLIVCISLFARYDYLEYIRQGNFLHAAFSFQHPSFWILFAVLVLGTVSLSLDACARIRRTGVDKILFPLPVHSLQLFYGMFLGVLVIILPLGAIGIFSLGLWQALYGHGHIVWMPYVLAYCYLVLPTLIPVTAGTITLRTLLKHDFSTLLAGFAVLAVVGFFREDIGFVFDYTYIAHHLIHTSPSIGLHVNHYQMLIPAIVHLVSALVVLIFAPLYLRRQEPQRYIRSRSHRWRVFAIPTFQRWITNLRVDAHLGWRYQFVLVLSILLGSAGALWAAYSFQDAQNQKRNAQEYARIVEAQEIEPPAIDILKMNLLIRPDAVYSRLRIRANMEFRTLSALQRINLELDPNYRVRGVTFNDQQCEFSQRAEWLEILLPAEMPANGTGSLHIRYRGVPAAFHPNYSALVGSWLPLPWKKVKTLQEGTWNRLEEDYFQSEIDISVLPEQTVAFAGKQVSSVMEEERRNEVWQTFHPVNRLSLYWGKYEVVEVEKPGYQVRFYHLPTQQYNAQVYLEEVEEQEEYVFGNLGALPFPQLTIVEVPYHWDTPSAGLASFVAHEEHSFIQSLSLDEGMPGLIPITENNLVYLHEGIWQLLRYDHDPRTIRFYQKLEPVLREVHDQFYKKLIGVYFEHALQPAGEYAFWLEEHLTSYVSKLLEQNPWVRRESLKYDVGSGPELPLSVAQTHSLIDLHRKGEYERLEGVRGEGLFRMLHHLLGDELWWRMMKELFVQYRFREITADHFLALAESYHGESLDWFKEQWLKGVALPSYEITFAEAKVMENKRDFSVYYEVELRVKNHGSGRMAVPIYIQTEMDDILRDVWLDAQEEGVLKLNVPHRPVFAAVDPQYKIVQEPFLDQIRNRRAHSERQIYIEGEDKAPGRRARNDDSLRGRRGRGRRGGFGLW